MRIHVHTGVTTLQQSATSGNRIPQQFMNRIVKQRKTQKQYQKHKQLVLKCENKFDLKMKKVVMDFKEEGSLFQSDGALNLNDLRPISL